MNKRSWLIVSLVLVLALTVFAISTVMAREPQSAGAAAPEAWYGAWQAGPDMPASVWGGAAGEGFARFSGYYYTPTNRIYFLGGRAESDATTGVVFYFDLTTRTYAATTATLQTPVSNYYVSQIDDDGRGHGPGLYVVAGRTSSGGRTNAVQVYYPDDNTVATITTDPFTANPMRLVGGQAEVDGKLYVFGGFDSTNMYGETYVYDPAAAAGARWTDTGCDLPTGRSYVSTVAVGHKLYAIGGDEFVDSNLTPISDTLVLDTDNMAACWQDADMADLPSANGDAPAVYVDEGFLGGGIYVVGGYWPEPGPYRWVFRYDVATDTWENFPQLAVQDPATGRRNQAAVYVPASATEGLGNGAPGIWTFGGYDGSGTNAMTNSSEFFSIKDSPVLVLPERVQVMGVGGGQAVHLFALVNQSGISDTFDLTYTADVTWTAALPGSIGPVADGGSMTFTMDVALPADASCPQVGVFTVTAAAQSNAVISDSQAVSVRIACGIGGAVYDANTNSPIPQAFVWLENVADPINLYYEIWTDQNGEYAAIDITPATYRLYASARGYQGSFYPSGWPTGAVTITVAGNSTVHDFTLVGSEMDWAQGNYSVTLPAGGQWVESLVITNSGSGPLAFSINELPGNVTAPPPARAGESAPRVDPQIYADLAAAPDGKADLLVVLKGEADLSAAHAMTDWNARGQYVVNALKAFAEQSQRELRRFLADRRAAYRPLYIVNGVIVRGGTLEMVGALAERSDVAYVRANHSIPAPKPINPVYNALSPDAIEWNIQRVNADDVWALGYTGQGMVVAEIDTGTQWDHPALVDHYRGWDGAAADHNYNWYDPYNQSPTVPHDVDGHGTHVMGTMVGDDAAHTNQVGMAPGARWMSCKGGDDVSGNLLTNELLLCAEWILAPWDLNGQNPNPAMRPHVVNNSWGGSPNDYWYTGAVAAWRAAGIFPAFANGNAGPACSTAHSPGDNWNTFSAGATTSTDAIADFSSRGPAPYTGILKPDISAPGASIRSSVPGNAYANYSGTSMASPHVAGAVALLWSADPELIGQIDTTAWVLQRNAFPLYTTQGCGGDTPTSLPNNVFGYGRLDILAAVTATQSGVDTLPWIELDPSGGIVAPAAAMPVDVTFHAPNVPGAYTGTLWLVADDPYIRDVRFPVRLMVEPTAPGASFTSSSPDFFGETSIFTNTSYGAEPINYVWDLGDGSTSTLKNPTHIYGAVGTFTVTLLVTNTLGESVYTDTVTIVDVPPQAGFLSAGSGSVGQVMVFTNTSTGTHLGFVWDWGDGMTCTLENPTHTYSVSGIYTVTLTAFNSAGSDEAFATISIGGPPVASFESSSPDLVGQTTFFTNTTQANPPVQSWLWNFGGGNISTALNPTRAFAAAGLYTITLTAVSPAGQDMYDGLVVICAAVVSGASFTMEPAAPMAGETVTFEGSVEAGGGLPVEYAWSFGDGGVATGITTTHVFTPAGIYTVTLTASGLCGEDTYTHSFEVGGGTPKYNIYLPVILKNN